MITNSIRRNIILNLILSASSIVLPLITYPYVARILEPENMGKLSYVSSIMNYFQWFAYLGVPIYGIKKVALVRNDKKKLSNIVGELIILNIFSIGITLIFIIISILYIPSFSNNKILFLIYTITLIFNTLNLEWLYKGMEEYKYITVRSLLCRIFIVVLTFLLVKEKTDYFIYATISLFGVFLTFIFNILHIKDYISNLELKKSLKKIKLHLKGVFHFFLLNVFATIFLNLDIIMLGSIAGNLEVGYYSVAIKIKTILITLISSIPAVLLPRMTRYLKDEKYDEFYSLIEKVLNIIIVVTLPLTFFFIIEAENCIAIIAGNKYELAIKPMIILMPLLLISGVSSILGYQILVPLNKEKQFFHVIVLGLFIDFILNCLWIKDYGSVGAARATLITEIIICIIEMYLLKNILKKISISSCIVKTLISSIIACLVLNLVSRVMLYKKVINFILMFVVFNFSWYICMCVLKEKNIKKINEIFIIKIRRK
ncbi:flippase [Fusobacterium perfoetens]|uniref:flippase n=1 Tax=Fusobacterium perfoetens TaxID=852 RepID=UPI0026F19E20|nr:flippase [Fusobacterium perfoetens]